MGPTQPGRGVSRSEAVHHESLVGAARSVVAVRGRADAVHRALDESHVPMVVLDDERRFVEANRAARLLLRLSLHELRRRRIDDMTPVAYGTSFGALWSRLMVEGRVAGPYDAVFEDGSELMMRLLAFANVLPGQHLGVLSPAAWGDEELGSSEESARDARPDSLSAREREVLTLSAEGIPLSEIAGRLAISPATVRTHVAHVYRKLGARNR